MNFEVSKGKTGKGSGRIGHYATILLEEIRGQLQTVAEAVELSRRHLDSKIDSLDRRLSQEIVDTRAALTVRIDLLEKGLQGVRSDMAEMKQELGDKIDSIGLRLDQHDVEITKLRRVRH